MQRLTHSPSPLVYIRRERDQFRARDSRCARANTVYFLEVP